MNNLPNLTIVKGDLLQQDVQVIVNAWNRNIIPWWLLLPQGISGAIKNQGGIKPFQEVAKYGSIPLGQARLTGAGRLDYQAIIHVAGINMFWLATEKSVTDSVKNAMQLVYEHNFTSVAFPLIGSGSGNRGQQWSKQLMLKAFAEVERGRARIESADTDKANNDVRVVLVEYDG